MQPPHKMIGPKLRIWGNPEIQARYKVGRMTVWRWRQDPDFPEPLAVLTTGPVFDQLEVIAWHKDRAASLKGRTRSRRLEGLRAYRRHGHKIAPAAREVGCAQDTLRAWLRELGEPTPSERRD